MSQVSGRFPRRIFCVVALTALIVQAPKAHAQASGPLAFTPEEQAFLAQASTIRMCVDPDWAPFERLDARGRHEGIAADLVQQVAQRTGLRIEALRVNSWDESLAASRAGRCQIMSFLNSTPERERWLIFTQPLFTDINVIITREEHPLITNLARLNNARVALPRGTMVEERIRRDFPNLRVLLTSSEPEAMSMVSERKADLTIRSMIVAADAIKKEGLFNLKVAGQLPEYANQLRIGVLKNQILLRDLLDKGVASITEPEREAIVNRHVAINIQRIDWTKIYLLLGALAMVSLIGIYILRNNRKLRQALQESQAARQALRIAATTFEAYDGMFITDAETRILRVNSGFTRITGYTAEEVSGATPRMFRSGRHDAHFYAEMWRNIKRDGAWQGEIWNRRKSGEEYPAQLTVSAVKEDTGTVSHYVATLHDITRRKQLEQEVYELAFRDPLTLLPNRRLFHDRLNQALARAGREKSCLGLLCVDLDKFKPINDQYGHETGDRVLQHVARQLEDNVRESDTVARTGGDEFLVLLPGLACAEDAAGVADKICKALQQPYLTPDGLALQASASIGVAVFPEHGRSEQDLLRLSDQAMYAAKNAGGSAVMMCSPSPEQVQEQSEGGVIRLHWKPGYACGHPAIDSEHRELFCLGNALLAAVSRRAEQPTQFDEAFDALLQHVVAHFAHEESILQAHGYVHFSEHALIHQSLVAQALRLRAAAREETDISLGQLVDFLVSEVIVRHMLSEDRKFFALFAQTRAETTSMLQ